ncbi:MAG: glycerophosphodiester phosphodiesterase family protein [Methylococcales bacterium]|nr:glycerophosphodiester phosphodiesterase family protein [Methylococcales bacterium]
MIKLRKPEKLPDVVLSIAHRGARAFAPENTLEAFQKAKAFHCQMIELDVRLSKDGVLMVHHDEDLIRCTDVKVKFPDQASYYVWDFTYDELATLDAGNWYIKQLSLPQNQRQAYLQTLTDDEVSHFVSPQDFDNYVSGNIRLPTLQQTLTFAKQAELMVNIELKSQPHRSTELANAVVSLVEFMEMDQQVLISSFTHDLLIQVRQLSNTLAIGVLTSERIENLSQYLQLLDADAYHPNCYSDSKINPDNKLNLEGVAFALNAGCYVNVWTCNNKDDMRQLIAAGVSGLISDFPNRVRDVLLAD